MQVICCRLVHDDCQWLESDSPHDRHAVPLSQHDMIRSDREVHTDGIL